MCGVAGFLGLGGTEAARGAVLLRMAAALAHRGPDGQGTILLGACGLAHTRLSIIDLATGAQPMADAEGTAWLSFNGEIFNYRELRDDLIARGHVFRTTSDTEVILQLYRRYGLDFVQHLNGDFAICLWDAVRRRLVLARDRMGVRPLYYAERGGMLAFASEVRALLSVPGIEAALDPIALDQIFTTWSPLGARTVFAGVSELQPGHMLVAEEKRTRLQRYWQLRFPDAADCGAIAEDRAAERVFELLADATRLRLRADVPVGAYLSGGLDSAITAALATRGGARDLHTYSVTFDDPEFDERAFQATMAEALGTRHVARLCTHEMIAAALPEVVSHAERPMLRTAPAPLYLLAEAVRADGLKVVLTGEGADEVFGGYDIFKEAKLRRFVGRQPHSTRRPKLLQRLYPYLPRLQAQSPQFLNAFFGGARDDASEPLFSHLPRYRSTARAKLFFSGELKRTLASYDALAELRESLPADFMRWHPLSQAQYLETTQLLPGYILSSQGDRMAMAHGVEGRFPFLDHRVVEFAASLPPELKLKGLREKHILREATKAILPPVIAQRPKQPYRAPDASLFCGNDAPLAKLFEPAGLANDGLFDAGAVARLARKAASVASLGFSDSSALVGIATTTLWRRQFAVPSVSAATPAGRPDHRLTTGAGYAA